MSGNAWKHYQVSHRYRGRKLTLQVLVFTHRTVQKPLKTAQTAIGGGTASISGSSSRDEYRSVSERKVLENDIRWEHWKLLKNWEYKKIRRTARGNSFSQLEEQQNLFWWKSSTHSNYSCQFRLRQNGTPHSNWVVWRSVKERSAVECKSNLTAAIVTRSYHICYWFHPHRRDPTVGRSPTTKADKRSHWKTILKYRYFLFFS